MSKVELKEGIFIEGFDDKKEFDMKLHYLVFNAPAPYREGKIIPILYEGKTSEISEEIAREYVDFGVCSDSGPHGLGYFPYYREYPKELNESCLFTAKESIKSACSEEYCIIYKTK